MGFFGNGSSSSGGGRDFTPEINAINSKLDKKEDKKGKLLEKVCFFYNAPHRINNLDNVEEAAKIFAQFDVMVFSDSVVNPSSSSSTKSKQVLARILELNPKAKIFGYIPIGMEEPNGDKLPLSEIQIKAERWKNVGAYGIFLDEFGYDYLVTRERQNACITLVRNLGMNVFVNSWEAKYVFSSDSIPIPWRNGFDGNPNRIPAIIGENDYTLFEEMLWSYESVGSGNDLTFNQIAKISRVESITEYTTIPRPEFGNKTWKEHYKTKSVGLDSIVEESQEMHDQGYYMALATGIDGYAPSTASWGSSSLKPNFPLYKIPEVDANNKSEIGKPLLGNHDGVNNVKVTTKVGKDLIEFIWLNSTNFNYNTTPSHNVTLSILINGKPISDSGQSWQRPSTPVVGIQYFDTDLGEVLIHKGNNIWGTISSKEFLLESRTDDPIAPEIGRIWIREDL